jgi:hypothetical protein
MIKKDPLQLIPSAQYTDLKTGKWRTKKKSVLTYM